MDDWNEWLPAHNRALAEWMLDPDTEPADVLGDASALRSATQWIDYFFDLEWPLIQTLGVLLNRATAHGAASLTTWGGGPTVATGSDVRCTRDGDEAALLEVLDDVLATGAAPQGIHRPGGASRSWHAACVRSGQPAHVLLAYDMRKLRSLGYLEGWFSPYTATTGDARHAQRNRLRSATKAVRNGADRHRWARPSLSDQQALTADPLLAGFACAGFGIFSLQDLPTEYRISRLHVGGRGWPDPATRIEAVFKADAGLVRRGDRLERSDELVAPGPMDSDEALEDREWRGRAGAEQPLYRGGKIQTTRRRLEEPEPEREALDRVRKAEIHTTLAAVLSPAVLNVVWDRLHDLSVAAIAERRSTTSGAVKKQLHKGRKAIAANVDALDLDHTSLEALGHALRDE
jgi:hypothetical protein